MQKSAVLLPALLLLTVSLSACGANAPTGGTPTDQVTQQFAQVTIDVAGLTTQGGGQLTAHGVPSGTANAELIVLDNGVEVLFDANGKIVTTGGSRIQLSASAPNRTINLLIGRTYDFKLTAYDSSATPKSLAYGERLAVTITGATTVNMNLQTLLGGAQLAQTRVSNGVIELGLQVYPTGRTDFTVPEGDYTVTYDVTGATIVAQSKLGVQIQPTTGSVSVTANVSGQIGPAQPGTVSATLNLNGDQTTTIKSDLSSPTVSITSPIVGDFVADGSLFSITGTANDNISVSHVEVYDGIRLLGNATLSAANWTYSWTPSAGSHTLTAVAYDAAGNTARSAIGVVTRDSTFGSQGYTLTSFGQYGDRPNAILLQPDGRIIAAGYSTQYSGTYGYYKTFALARYNADGTADTTFGSSGKVTSDPVGGTASRMLNATALQPDGRIIAVGNSNNASIIIARYLSSGATDSSLFTSYDLGTNMGEDAKAVAIQPDGKVLIAGYLGGDALLARFNANGGFDTTFGTGGKVTLDLGGTADVANAVAVQTDGSILIAGNGNGTSFMARYTASGAPDDAFGSTGKVLGSAGSNTGALTVLADGRIVTAGNTVSRYSTAGVLDTTFGTNGSTALPGTTRSIAVTSDGKLVIGTVGGTYRLTGNGAFDTNFGSNGAMNATSYAVAVQSDDKIVSAWSALVNYEDDFFIYRVHP